MEIVIILLCKFKEHLTLMWQEAKDNTKTFPLSLFYLTEYKAISLVE